VQGSTEDDWNEVTCKPCKIEDLAAGQVEEDVKVYVDCKYGGYTEYMNELVHAVKLYPMGDLEKGKIIGKFFKNDNLRVYGLFRGEKGKPNGMFHMFRIKPLPSDDDEYSRRRYELKPGDVDARLALGDWAMGRYRTYGSPFGESLRKKALDIYKDAIQILEEGARPDDYDRHLQIATLHLERMEDRDRCLAKLKETCLKWRPDHPDLIEFLRKRVGATQYRGQWVPYEQFKNQEGFVQRPDRTWVREPIDLLEKFAAKPQGPLPPRIPDDPARAKGIAIGMNVTQIIRGGGYPDTILRMPSSGGPEIWVYPHIYLFLREQTLIESRVRTP
jgi:hypothetical protein